jgi:hypothetical protein
MLPFSVVLLQQIHCYPIGLLRYYGNASNSLLFNSNHHVTIVMQQTHYYSTVTITLLWKSIWCIGHVTTENVICHNMQSVPIYFYTVFLSYYSLMIYHCSHHFMRVSLFTCAVHP